MANDLTTTSSSALANPNYNPFLDAADDMGATGGFLYAKFDGNTGNFTYGKDDEELEKGSRHAVNPSEFKRGYICWNDGKVVEEIMVRITDGRPPAKDDLKDHGPYADDKDGWREQSSIAFRDITTGDEFLYKTSSKSGNIAVANLIRDYGKQFQMHPGELAIIELGANVFEPKNAQGKKLGKKYAPSFKIVGWKSEAALMEQFSAAEEADGVDEDDAPLPVNTAASASAAPAGRRRF